MRSDAIVARRATLAAAAILAVVAVVAVWQALSGGPLWRRAYPSLPQLVQGLPYRLKARLPAAHATPAPLPTVRADTDALATIHAVRAAPTDVPGPRASPPATSTGAPATALARAALPPSASIAGARHAYQTWNNCGPATLSMALAVWGVGLDQAQTARVLKPDPDDKNVSPDELEAFARGLPEVSGRYRVGGDLELLRRMLAAGVPVIVETWFVPEPDDEMGHYRLLVGYEGAPGEAGGHFRAFDSYHGPDLELDYGAFDGDWRVFNRALVAVYPRSREDEVAGLMGPLADDEAMAAAAVAQAQAEAGSVGDAFAWFNLGSSLVILGDDAGAADAFDRARAIGLPWRMLWYQFGPFEAYAATERWADVEALARANLANAPNLEESLYWLGRAEEAAGDASAARASYEKALGHNPGYRAPRDRLAALDGGP